VKNGPNHTKWTIDLVRDRCRDEEGCWVWAGCTVNGYPQATINGKGGQLVKRWVWIEGMGKAVPKKGKIVNTCGNRLCLNPEHLRCASATEVLRRAYKSGARNTTLEYMQRVTMLQKQGRTKLSFEAAQAYRQRASEGEHYAALAKEANVCRSQMRKVVTGKAWRQQVKAASVFNWRP
jgi:hypothetical protein